jgi:hypothetical protein
MAGNPGYHLRRLTVSLNLNDKKAVVAEVSAKVATAQTIVVAEYRGIQVAHLTQLRAKARQGVYLRVLKNTLARRSVEGTHSPLADSMTGPLIYRSRMMPLLLLKSSLTSLKPTTNWLSKLVTTQASAG